jgi:hypothetical protein
LVAHYSERRFWGDFASPTVTVAVVAVRRVTLRSDWEGIAPQRVAYWPGVPGLERHDDQGGAVVVDDRFYPVLIGTWLGTMSPAIIDHYYAWYDRQLARAAAEGIELVLVSDALDVHRPTGETRARLVRETDAREAVIRERVVGLFVVVRGALLLGMVASIVQRVRGGLRMSTFRDMPTALERALLKLDHRGVPRPAGLDPRRYTRPSSTAHDVSRSA